MKWRQRRSRGGASSASPADFSDCDSFRLSVSPGTCRGPGVLSGAAGVGRSKRVGVRGASATPAQCRAAAAAAAARVLCAVRSQTALHALVRASYLLEVQPPPVSPPHLLCAIWHQRSTPTRRSPARALGAGCPRAFPGARAVGRCGSKLPPRKHSAVHQHETREGERERERFGG